MHRGRDRGCRVKIITARFPGIAADGTMVHKGREILWDARARRVVTACPVRIAEWRAGHGADPTDIAFEDACAREAGVDSLSPFRD
jgi:hypothetical protein